MPECEAERRIKQTLYVLENDWASGSFDYGKVKQMLTEAACDCATRPNVGNIS